MDYTGAFNSLFGSPANDHDGDKNVVVKKKNQDLIFFMLFSSSSIKVTKHRNNQNNKKTKSPHDLVLFFGFFCFSLRKLRRLLANIFVAS